MHRYQDLIMLFDSTFAITENTRLIKGSNEPLYLPANAQHSFHQIIFAHGYFSSALHEVAHWCIAGKARRQLEDYGYWYCPDGRDSAQQKAFEQVEVKPQALEYAFCLASGFKFNVSTDNLNGVEPDRDAFAQRVNFQYQTYLRQGFPARAKRFIDVLTEFYQADSVASSGEKDCIVEDYAVI